MKKDVIMEIFDFLKLRGIIASEGEFSMDWLGQCDSYFRGLRFKQTEPTLGVVAICGSRMLKASEFIRRSPKHQQIADMFLELGNRCQHIVNAGAAELELV